MERKYLWKKKQDYISNVESSNRHLYRGKTGILLTFYSEYITTNDELQRYLFTEKEANEILGDTFYMFERIEVDVQDNTSL